MLSPFQSKTLKEGAQQLSLTLNDHQLQQFGRYLSLIEEYNKKFNLTRIVGDDAISGHFLDALTGVLAVPEMRSQKLKVVDAGSGVGIPGIALKIAFPQLEMTLIDSHQKRVGFLEYVISELKLEYVRAYAARLESIGSEPKFSKTFDLAIARALAEPREALSMLTGLLNSNGKTCLYISSNESLDFLRHESYSTLESPFNGSHTLLTVA